MTAAAVGFCFEARVVHSDVSNPIEEYFSKCTELMQQENWNEMIILGEKALKAATATQKEIAQIANHLASTSFYLGNYVGALEYANRAYKASADHPEFLVKALYLQSAAYRGFASKSDREAEQQRVYKYALEKVEAALQAYEDNKLGYLQLLAKIYFNLGAAHADNPKGNLEEAEVYYRKALIHAQGEDEVRCQMRLAKVYLRQEKYDAVGDLVNTIRPQLTTERNRMHCDYLEAQLEAELGKVDDAIKIARNGMAKAQLLGAKEDELRFQLFLNKMES